MRARSSDVMVGFQDNRRRAHSKRLATGDGKRRGWVKERETTKARVPARGWLTGWLAGFGAKVSALECGITISKPDVTFVGQWPRDDPFACNCVSFTTPTALCRALVRAHPCPILTAWQVIALSTAIEMRKWFHADLSARSFVDYLSFRLFIDWCHDLICCFFSFQRLLTFFWLISELFIYLILNCS